jgi:hypothetical protein
VGISVERFNMYSIHCGARDGQALSSELLERHVGLSETGYKNLNINAPFPNRRSISRYRLLGTNIS